MSSSVPGRGGDGSMNGDGRAKGGYFGGHLLPGWYLHGVSSGDAQSPFLASLKNDAKSHLSVGQKCAQSWHCNNYGTGNTHITVYHYYYFIFSLSYIIMLELCDLWQLKKVCFRRKYLFLQPPWGTNTLI